MINLRNSLIWALAVSVFILPLSDVATWARAAEPAPPTTTLDSVRLLGEGAEVKLKLTDGLKVKGVIESYGDEGLVLNTKRSPSPRTIDYAQITQLRPAKRSYKASGQPDPVEARRAVVGLGVGQHIMVKQVSNQELHGNIQPIGMESFSMLPDHQQAPVEIAYSDVKAVHKNLSAGATLAVVVGIVAAAALIAVFLTGSDTVRGSL
jgi:hypothetical protein